MKYKYIIVIFILGAAGFAYAAFRKIQHEPNEDIIFRTSLTLIGIAIFLGLLKMLSTKNEKSFLNK